MTEVEAMDLENMPPANEAPAAKKGKGKGKGKGRTIEQIYQKKSQLEHILLRPDT